MKTEKQTKSVKKSTSKKPEYFVDLTDVKTPNDVYVEFALAKQKAGKPLTDNELETIIGYAIYRTLNTVRKVVSELPYKEVNIEGDEKIILDAKGNIRVKKPNIFRRFWNWLTRKG